MVVLPDPGAPEIPTRYRSVGPSLPIRLDQKLKGQTLNRFAANAPRGHLRPHPLHPGAFDVKNRRELSSKIFAGKDRHECDLAEMELKVRLRLNISVARKRVYIPFSN